ncbi:MAG: exodeoxyribonuclease VII small subunit [Gammaproteobacteria bacterium]|jgi:exodeoxyribonuclease VII small subunit
MPIRKKSSDATSSTSEAALDFESALNELETLVTRMETGEGSLESALQDYERGVELVRIARVRLDAAEQKVEVLRRRGTTAAEDHYEDLVPTVDSDVDA